MDQGRGARGGGDRPPPRRPLPPKGWREAARRATEGDRPAAAAPARRGKPPPRALALLGKAFWTVGGLGLVPGMPGTVGTLAGVAIVYGVTKLPSDMGLSTDMVVLGLACFFTLVGVPLASLAERVHGKDPQSFVWDEVTGYLVTMLAMPVAREQVLCIVGGFFAFRIFDILKPWPIRGIESKPGGISVIADDIVAGLYANATLHAVLLFR